MKQNIQQENILVEDLARLLKINIQNVSVSENAEVAGH